MSELAMTIGKRLRECRAAKGLTQEELANLVDMNPAHIGQIERGTKCPTVRTLDTLLEGLNISFTSFFNFEHSANKKERPIEIEKIDSILVTLAPQELEAVYTVLKGIVKGFKEEK